MLAFFKSVVVLSAVASLAITGGAANPVASDTCSQGTVSCCNMMQSPTNLQQRSDGGLLGGLLDSGLLSEVDLGNLLDLASQYPGDIGIGCSGEVHCQQQTACCTHTSFNGVINVGCSPINVNL